MQRRFSHRSFSQIAIFVGSCFFERKSLSLDFTQKDWAYDADLDRSYIASVENGSRNISIVNIEKIAIALNVTLKQFFDYGDFK